MFFILHIFLMATASLGVIVGVSFAMFFRSKKNWLKFHRTINLYSFGGITMGIIMAFIYVSDSGGKHFEGLHQIVGVTAFVLALITLSMGYYQFKAKNKSAARITHRWLGRFSLLMFLTAITLGLMLINII
jgi:hypothetical protein